MSEMHATPVNAAAAKNLLAVQDLVKVFGDKGSVTRALSGITFEVEPHEFVAVMGPSGSGKTTLLDCIATIETATSGQVFLDGTDITRLRSKQLARFRREQLGFIFQDSNLIDTMTAYENIALALTIKKEKPQEIGAKVLDIASKLGIMDVMNKLPGQMSGGQRQRVCAARAVVGEPKLVLADEPTGALDSKSSRDLLEVLGAMNEKWGTTIMMVTHDSFAASYASRVMFLKDGRLFNQMRRGNMGRQEFFSRIMEVVALLGGENADAR